MIWASDHVDRGLAKLLERYKGTKSQAFVAAFLAQVQDLENAAREVAEHLNLTDGFGIILDNIGRLIGRGRDAADDDEYRFALRAQAHINRSTGGLEDAVIVGDLGTQTTGQTYVRAFNPCAYEVHFTGAVTTAARLATLRENNRAIRPLGRRGFFCYAPVARALVHVAGWSQDTEIGAGIQGAGWTQDTEIGGRLAYAVDLEPMK